MLEIAVCDDDMADLECAVTMLHKIFTSQQIAYHIEQFVSANQMLENISNIDIGILDISMEEDRKSTRLNSSHIEESRMPSSA